VHQAFSYRSLAKIGAWCGFYSLRRIPQLHPALLRLSAIISQYLRSAPCTLLIVQNRLRRRFGQFRHLTGKFKDPVDGSVSRKMSQTRDRMPRFFQKNSSTPTVALLQKPNGMCTGAIKSASREWRARSVVRSECQAERSGIFAAETLFALDATILGNCDR